MKSSPEKVMGHTEGKLEYRKNPWDDGKYDLRSIEKGALAYAPLAHVKGDKRVTRGNGEANARRLVACWNSCDGIPTERLEEALSLTEQPMREAAIYRDLLERDKVELMELLHEFAYDGLCTSRVNRAKELLARLKNTEEA